MMMIWEWKIKWIRNRNKSKVLNIQIWNQMNRLGRKRRLETPANLVKMMMEYTKWLNRIRCISMTRTIPKFLRRSRTMISIQSINLANQTILQSWDKKQMIGQKKSWVEQDFLKNLNILRKWSNWKRLSMKTSQGCHWRNSKGNFIRKWWLKQVKII